MSNKILTALMGVLLTLSFTACQNDYMDCSKPHEYPDANVYGTKQIYIPDSLKSNDFNDAKSKWCYARSRQSENFICFWEEGFGSNPKYAKSKYIVDIDDLMAKCEQYFNYYTNTLKFVNVGSSNTDKYKMMIFINYSTEWLATGAGYDNVIGALWINPSAAQPVGSTIAHEVGHCFQYQVYCDDAAKKAGFRYGTGDNGAGGNAFWESCAQWQSFQLYPDQKFTNSYFSTYINGTYKNFMNEDTRYANYFIQDYWCSKHGLDFVGKLWRGAQSPEDPVEAYKRITGVSQSQFNDEFYEYSSKMVTWDLDAIRENGANYINHPTTKMNQVEEDGPWRVDKTMCPENYGYNIIQLNAPTKDTNISVNFTGEADISGFNAINVDKAGWRYGFVALKADGTTVYSEMGKDKNGTLSFNCPACSKLWLVVTGAPTEHFHHEWDDNNSNDEQWPYQVKFKGTNIYGVISIDTDKEPEDITFTYNLAYAKNNDYTGGDIAIDINQIGNAFALTKKDLTNAYNNGSIKLYAIEPDGTLNGTYTADAPGHWLAGDGSVTTWGKNSVLFCDYYIDNVAFYIGLYPDLTAGSKYTVKEALVYKTPAGKTVQATFIFNVSITN